MSSFSVRESYIIQKRLTKRAPDVWDSAAFSSIFLASSFSCSQALSTPAHTQVTQTVRCVLSVRLLGSLQNQVVLQIGV